MKKRTILHIIICVIVCAFSGIFSCGDGSMNGIYDMFGKHPFIFVNSSAPAGGDGLTWSTAYNNLPTAITAAQNGQGEEIWMTAGSYSGTVAAGINVSLYGGFSGTETSRDDRDVANHATSLDLTISANGVVIDNMNGFIGNVTIRGNSPLTIKHGTFNNKQGGTGIICYGTVELSKCRFTESSVGGLLCESGSSVTVEDCTFAGNGGSTIEINTGTCIINNSTIKDGNTSYSGAGINIMDGTCTITNSTIENCKAGSSGCGIYSDSGSTCKIVNSTIRNNSGGYVARGAIGGGGIYSAGNLIIRGSVISDNTAIEVSGGGIFIEGGGTVTIESSTIRNCSGAGRGGAIYANGNDCTISNTIIQDCSVIGTGIVSGGGGVYVGDDGTCTITGSTIRNCRGSCGGAVYVAGGASTSCTITGCTITGNSAEAASGDGGGGGIFVAGVLSLNSTTVSGNRTTDATGVGGGIFANGTMHINGSHITGNTASSAGNGNEAHLEGATGDVENSTIGSNVYTGLVSLPGTFDFN